MTSIRHFPRLALIVALVLLSQVLNAADFGTKHDPKGPLGIRLDYALATQSNAQAEQAHNWVFSSHITFKSNVEDITDGQLVKMVADTYLEMEADILQYSPKIKGGKPLMQPGAMSIMATGMEILFSSSQKGTTAFINTVADSPVKEQLELCMATWKDAFPNTDKPDHKNSRKCGEIMAAHQYYQIHSEKLGSLSPLPRVTTVTRLRSGEMLVIPPCGSDREELWGCDLFLVDLEASAKDGLSYFVRYVDDVAPEDYDLMNLAGGLQFVDQIESCASRSSS